MTTGTSSRLRPALVARAPTASARTEIPRATVHPDPLSTTTSGGMRASDGPRTTLRASGVELDAGGLWMPGVDDGEALPAAAARLVGTGALGRLRLQQQLDLWTVLSKAMGQPGSGRAAIQERAAAGALLEELLRSIDADTAAGSGLVRSTFVRLRQAALAERDPGLRHHLQRRLLALPTTLVPGDQRAWLDALAEQKRSDRPPTSWLRGIPPMLDVTASVQDGFWNDVLKSFTDRGYVVKMTGPNNARAVRVVHDVTPPVQIQVTLRRSDEGIFDAIDDEDADVILYTGHANLGAVAHAAVRAAPPRAAGQKMLALFACRSKQSQAALTRAFPGQQLLLTDQGSYAHDDDIVMHALLDGIARGRDYRAIERAARAQGLWERNNYLLPDEVAAQEATPALYLAPAPGRSSTFGPPRARGAKSDAATLADGGVDDAVAFLNTIWGYWAEDHGTPRDRALQDRLVSGGYFDGDEDDPIVRLEHTADGYVIRIHEAWAHQRDDALAMAVTFAAAEQLLQQTQPSLPTHDRRLLALSMTVTWVFHFVPSRNEANALLARFSSAFGFPPGLDLRVVEQAIEADLDTEASPAMRKVLDKALGGTFREVDDNKGGPSARAFRADVAGALAWLRSLDGPIAKATVRAVDDGQVRIDSFSDLTTADYERLRREMLRAGVHLPVQNTRGAQRRLEEHLDGFMWDDRVYVSRGQTPRALARTLVHEVNHVQNASEEHYRSERDILREEYRAVLAEALVSGKHIDKRARRSLKEQVIRDYKLQGVGPDDVADDPTSNA